MIGRFNISKYNNAHLNRATTLAMIVLGACSLLFSNYRLYGDSADYLFQLVQFKSFYFAHSRPASIFIEWLPLLFIKLNAPMQYVIKALSFAEWIWLFGCFLAFRFWLKAESYSIAIVFVYLFGIRWNYFNPVSELILAFPLFLFLHFSLRNFEKLGTVKTLSISTILIGFLLFSHPLYYVAVSFLLLWIWLENNRDKRIIWIFLSFLALAIIRYLFLDQYDKDPLSKLSEPLSLQQTIDKFTFIPHIIDLMKAYAGFVIVFAFGIWQLWKQKRYLSMALLISFVFGFAGLVIFKFGFLYPETYEPFERYLFIIPLAVTTVLIPQIKQANNFQIAAFVFAIGFHFVMLFNYAMLVDKRYSLFENAIENSYQFEECKVVYRKENYHLEFISNRDNGHDWIQSSESLLLSSAKGPDSTKQVFIKEILPDDFYTSAEENQFLLYPSGWKISSDTINENYMHLPHSKWKIANTDSVQTFTAADMKQIQFACTIPFESRVNEKIVLQISLTNHLNRIVYSGIRKAKSGIGYRWFNPKDGSFSECLFLSPLMADLHSTVQQKMIVIAPETAGDYVLVPGWITAQSDRFYPFSGNARLRISD